MQKIKSKRFWTADRKEEKGITLVALIITIIVLIILAAVTIYVVVESNLVDVATKGTENYSIAQVNEVQELDATVQKLEETVSNIVSIGANKESTTGGDDTPKLLAGWEAEKVDAVKSDDGIIVPLPKGFTVSEVKEERKVKDGFVIKYGVNEFVWVPVDKPSEMFGIDKDRNFLGKLYDFGTDSSPKNPPEPLNWTETEGIMSWTNDKEWREVDILTDTTSGDATTNGINSLKAMGIAGENNADILANWKRQLQDEFKEMKESVERYGGFYIGRYETGNLSQSTAVVAKGNEDTINRTITYQNWYDQYIKSKTIAQGTAVKSSMIWGCQWDAVMKWYLKYDDTKGYVTNSEGANYTKTKQPTGYHKVKNIYDMAGNVYEWTIEAIGEERRTLRRRLQH